MERTRVMDGLLLLNLNGRWAKRGDSVYVYFGYLVIFILHYYFLNVHVHLPSSISYLSNHTIPLNLNIIHPRVEHPTNSPPNDDRNPSWRIHLRKPSLSLAFLLLRCCCRHYFLFLQSPVSLLMNASCVDSEVQMQHDELISWGGCVSSPLTDCLWRA